MASLSIARPGKVSERQYLGDLAGLFDRQRRRAGVALTPDSFAADLAANDSLRSGLFSLCNAISHMGEQDLSPEELLGLIARALGGAGSAEGEAGAEIPASMRDAFLAGYEAWNNRDLQPISEFGEPEVWPPAAPARKPPVREEAEFRSEPQAIAAAASGPVEPLIPAASRRTVQEALSLVRHEHGGDLNPQDSHPALTGPAGEALGSMTLGELKHFLEDIEHRFSRLGPQIHQLSSAAREPSRRERSAPLSDSVIQFPVRHASSAADPLHVHASDDPDAFVRRRPIPAPNMRAEDALLAQATETDERPRGIDALVAAAPAWASATPTTRTFDEESFLARHAYLSPKRRPGTLAPTSVYYAETPAAPLAPPTAAQAPMPDIEPVAVTAVQAVPPAPPLIGLDAEDDPLLSPWEQLESYMMHLQPRRVFTALAGLTVLAGGLAGFIAYRTLHPSRIPQFQDLEQSARLSAPAPPITIEQAAPAATAQSAASATARTFATVAPPKARGPVVSSSRSRSHVPLHTAAVAVWPPIPPQLTRDMAPSVFAPTAAPTAHNTVSQAASTGPLFVPAPTMIGYALASPQPAYPVGQAHGVSGTIAVEITISRLGDVTSAHAVSGPQELRSAAVAAVRNWHFRPYLVDGRPAEVATTLQFFFKGE